MNIAELGGISVNEAEAIAKAIEEGEYNIVEEEGDWIWTIWVATGRSAPVYIEFNKNAGFLRVYRQSYVKEVEKVQKAVEAAWNRTH